MRFGGFFGSGARGKKRQISLHPFQGYFFSVPSRVMPLFDKFLASVVAAAASAVETCDYQQLLSSHRSQLANVKII